MTRQTPKKRPIFSQATQQEPSINAILTKKQISHDVFRFPLILGCPSKCVSPNIQMDAHPNIHTHIHNSMVLLFPPGFFLGFCVKYNDFKSKTCLLLWFFNIWAFRMRFFSCKQNPIYNSQTKALAAEGFLLVFYRIAFVGQHLSVSISLSISTALLQSMLWMM